MDIKKHDGFMTLTVIYIAGGVYAVIVLLVNYDRPQAPASSAYALIFLVWGRLDSGQRRARALRKAASSSKGPSWGRSGPWASSSKCCYHPFHLPTRPQPLHQLSPRPQPLVILRFTAPMRRDQMVPNDESGPP